jgi:peptidoglycan hydrolase-like protein with peptidoglycan-binding domain
VPDQRDLSSPVPWRRSLRAAQQRRARLARHRRRVLQGRTGALVAVALSSIAAGGALAQDSPRASSGAGAPATVSGTLRAAQQKLGVTADGVNGPRTRAAVRRFQRRNGLAVDGIVGPQTLAALGLAAVQAAPRSATGASGGDAGATLAKIARCESGGDPGAVSAGGTYRGKYQFDRTTWRQLGGSGDPAAAPEAEQDQRALALYRRRGTAPWPNCA